MKALGKKFTTVLQVTSAVKEDMHLTPDQHQHVTNIEMKAFAAVTAQRMNLARTVRERKERREKEGVDIPKTDLYAALEVTRDATAFVEEVTEVTERKLEDLGFTKREEEGLRLKQLQRDPKTGRFSWYSTVGEPPKPPPAASVFPPSAKLP